MRWLFLHGESLDSFRRGPVTQKTNHMIRRLRLGASQTSSEERGLATEFNNIVDDLINHAYLNRLNSGHQDSVELPGWWTYWLARRVTCLDSTMKGHRSSGLLPRLALCILHHKTVIVSIVLFWVLRHSSKLSNLRDR